MKTKNSRLAQKLFVNMINLLGLKAIVEHDESKKVITLSIETEEAGRLIGRNGTSLNSLNLLMNNILCNKISDFPKLNLNIIETEKKSKLDISDVQKQREKKLEKHRVDNVFNVYLDKGKSEEKVIDQKKLKRDNKQSEEDTIAIHCNSALKELKRWGEDVLLPPVDVAKVDQVIDFFSKEASVEACIDEKKSFEDKKRIRISNSESEEGK